MSDFDPSYFTRDMDERAEDVLLQRAQHLELKNLPLGMRVDNTIEVSFSRRTGITSSDASIQSVSPLFAFDDICYYEVTVKGISANGIVAVGLAERNYPKNKQPGWNANSWGYHGDDGNIFNHSPSGSLFGPTFGMSDVIGCGLKLKTREIFFTKNGKFLGIAFSRVQIPESGLHATVGLDNSSVSVNFGTIHDPPFSFNIKELREAERAKSLQDILTSPSTPSPSPSLLLSIVKSYLSHCGHSKTFEALNQSGGVGVSSGDMIGVGVSGNDGTGGVGGVSPKISVLENSPPFLEERHEVMSLIRGGHIQPAIEFLQSHFPTFLSSNQTTISLLLETQNFIEVLKIDFAKNEFENSLKIVSERLSQFFAPAAAPISPPPSTPDLNSPMSLGSLSPAWGGGGADSGTPPFLSSSSPNPSLNSNHATKCKTDFRFSWMCENEKWRREEGEGGQFMKWREMCEEKSVEEAGQLFLQDVVGLLAYKDPSTSPLAHLLSQNQREHVAVQTNKAILEFFGEHRSSVLERLCQQFFVSYVAVKTQ